MTGAAGPAPESRRDRGGLKARLQRFRDHRAVDRVLRVQEHYGKIQGGLLASSATYFAFLAFFPLLAVAFAVVGYVSQTFPNARESLITAIETYLPGIVSESGGNGTISLTQIENAKVAVGLIGFAGVLYSGLGWITGLRNALAEAFEVPRAEKRNFVLGKVVDLVALAVLGVILIASVGVASLVTGWTRQILDAVSLDDTALGGPMLWVIATVLGVAISTVLFFVMYRVLGNPPISAGPLWRGALLAAVGFEILKIVVVNILGAVGGSGFAPLALAITLVVWINYFSKLAVYGACWAATADGEAAAPAAMTVDDGGAAELGDESATEPLADEAGLHPRPRFDLGSAVVGLAAGLLSARVWASRRRDRGD